MIILILGVIFGFLLSVLVIRSAINNGWNKVLAFYFPESDGFRFNIERRFDSVQK